MRRVTIRDVAVAASVSPATVSNTINSTRFVSEEVRERVFNAMSELGYEPNTLARGLRSRRTRTIGVIIANIVNPFHASLATVIENKAEEADYSVVLCLSHYNLATEDRYVRTLVGKQVDGIIVGAAGDNESSMRYVRRHDVPVVVLDRVTSDASIDLVTSDNRKGGYLAARHLLDLGHRHIAYVAGPSGAAPPRDRLAGFRDAILETGGDIRPEWVFYNPDFDFVRAKEIAQQLLEMPEMPTAICFANDHMALAGITGLNTAGLKVPEDVSVIGFDDIWVSAISTPPLTTVRQDIDRMAEEAFTLLLNRMTSDEPVGGRRVVFDVQLVERDSCRALNV